MYWFRTPPGVRVGRPAIDEEAMRLLEQHNPDVQFDWPRLLKEQPAEPAPRRERDGREGREGREGRDRRERRDQRPAPRPRAMETSGAAVPPLPSPEAAEEIQALAEAAEARATEHAEMLSAELGATEYADSTDRTGAMEYADVADLTGATEYADRTERTGPTDYADITDLTGATEYTDDTERTGATEYAEVTEVTDATEPSASERDNREPWNGELANRELANGELEPTNREPSNREPSNREPEPENREPENREPAAAAARLGADGVARLRARYLDIVARLDDKPLEEANRAELKAAAERLNPDTWRTADEVALALEQYETVFESLRAVVGRHPRRRV